MSDFLRACRREPTPYTPIWLMRQAGRYQPEYRAMRGEAQLRRAVQAPDLAAEVTLLPVTQLGVDAAILFADILLMLEPLGHRLRVHQGRRAADPAAGPHARRDRRGGERRSTPRTRSAT